MRHYACSMPVINTYQMGSGSVLTPLFCYSIVCMLKSDTEHLRVILEIYPPKKEVSMGMFTVQRDHQ